MDCAQRSMGAEEVGNEMGGGKGNNSPKVGSAILQIELWGKKKVGSNQRASSRGRNPNRSHDGGISIGPGGLAISENEAQRARKVGEHAPDEPD